VRVTGRGDPQDCDTSRLPHSLGNLLIDGGEVVCLTRRPALRPNKIPGTHFYQRLSRTQGHRAAENITLIEILSDFIGNLTHDLPTCGIVAQTSTLTHPLIRS
jgi:hypothetical protein